MFMSLEKGKSIINIAQKAVLRVAAVVFLILAIQAWGGIIGYKGPGFAGLYTTMQAFFLILGLFAPITAFGLWACGNWAVVMWFFGAFGVVALDQIAYLSIDTTIYILLIFLFLIYLSLLAAQRLVK